MNVVLIGMKHCGKSTVGRALAERWRWPFFDVDDMIETTHACATGERLSVREIFRGRGETYFHQLEGQVVCDIYLKLEKPGAHGIVSLGGRTALNTSINRLLGGIGLIVYLQVAPHELFERIRRTGLPPFLRTDDPERHFLELLAEREPEYRRLAQLTVDLDGLGVTQATDALERQIREHLGPGAAI